MNGIDLSNVSLWGDDWSNLFGVCLFNFAVVVAIPAWLYEKKPSVNVSTGKLNGATRNEGRGNFSSLIYISIYTFYDVTCKSEDLSFCRSFLLALNGSSVMAFVLYVLVGSLGAMTMHNVADNMLQSMMSGEFGEVTEISSMTFAFFIIGLGIPLFR